MSESRGRPWLITALGAGTLLAELAHTRVVAYVLWNHLVYFTITMAFAGFACAGAALAAWPDRFRRDPDGFLGWCALALGGTLAGTLWLCVVLPLHTPSTFDSWESLAVFFAANTLLLVPYFLFGLLVSACLLEAPGAAQRLYGLNLIGSGLGAVGFVLLLPALTAPGLVLLVAFGFALVALVLLRPRSRRGTAAALVCMGIAGIASTDPDRFVPLRPEPNKEIHTFCPTAGSFEYVEWNPLSRVDVCVVGERARAILYDGAARADMAFDGWDPERPLPTDRWKNAGIRTFVFHARPNPERVLVLGVGGGLDVQFALLHGARDVTGVEIHEVTVKLLRRTYDRLLHGLFNLPYVHLVQEDGRSFVRRTDQRYDVIAMVGIDSFTALSTGAYVLYESYIYTLEAIQDYVRRLDDDGVLSISRWLFRDKPRETLRLFATAYEGLRRLGGADPLAHLAVIAADSSWATLLVSRRPFDAATLDRVESGLTMEQAFLFRPDRTSSAPTAFERLAQALRAGKQDEFFRAYPYDVTPVGDDSPFFFQYTKLDSVVEFLRSGERDIRMITQGNWTWIVMLAILVETLILSALIVIVPSRRMHRSGVRVRHRAGFYFAAVGLAYALMQLAIVQKLVLFLTHPVYSMAVVIPALLVFGGAGSWLSSRVSERTARRLVLATPLVIAAYARGLTPLLEWLAPASVTGRAFLVVLLLLPLGLLVGVPFASGLRMLASRQPLLGPWFFALNGAASVLGTVGAVLVAILAGFSSAMLLACACYLAAAVALSAETRAG